MTTLPAPMVGPTAMPRRSLPVGASSRFAASSSAVALATIESKNAVRSPSCRMAVSSHGAEFSSLYPGRSAALPLQSRDQARGVPTPPAHLLHLGIEFVDQRGHR